MERRSLTDSAGQGKAKTEGELGFGVAVLVAQGHQGSQPGGYQPGEHWLAPWRQGRKRLLCQLRSGPLRHRISSKLWLKEWKFRR
jgi:hypothetical protein